MSGMLALTLFTYDGETATVNPMAVMLLVFLIGLAWSVFR